MKKYMLPLVIPLAFGLLLFVLGAYVPRHGAGAAAAQLPAAGLDLYLGRIHNNGTIKFLHQGIFGPNICTSYGDPFSPLESPWQPGLYTYQYRILIPSDYPADEIRVELFDPDSINNNVNEYTILHTQTAIDQGAAASEPGSCEETDQIHPCVESTDELELVGRDHIARINPFWFMRVDENRGHGDNHGDGFCAYPFPYAARYNTRTVYELFYWEQNADGTVSRIPLATYSGQVDDGIRDNGGHDTDMRWVSPGAPQSFDQPVFVPVDAGSPKTFQLTLATDLPNIHIDPVTGDRYLYLDVTTVSGASENGFDIWAGPPDYIGNIPSEVNARNVVVANDPKAHRSLGISVSALERLPVNALITETVDIPLTYIGAEHAGATASIAVFDIDVGAKPPITFYFDSIAQNDWSVTFGEGVDPEGRCFAGGANYTMQCNNRWIDPPYEIPVPGDQQCDFTNPTAETCTPFYGGRLTARFQPGQYDTFVWEINVSPASDPVDPTVGCSAFPIAVHEGVRSVTPPGQGADPYPQPEGFDYPPVNPGPDDPPQPRYEDFITHDPNIPLESAKEGDVYKVQSGFGEGNFGWLLWNEGRPGSAGVLADSLTWPGDSTDYTDHGDTVIYPAADAYNHIVRGYVEPGDSSDITLHVEDWMAANTGAVDASPVHDALRSHIQEEGRTLRLPVWDDNRQVGTQGYYRIKRFAIFRLHGYQLAQGGDAWLLLEFIRWDDSCGQVTAEPTPTATATATAIDTATATATATATSTAIATATATATSISTSTPTPSATPTVPGASTATPTATPHIPPPEAKLYLPYVANRTSWSIFIGAEIATRPVTAQGETFYQVPIQVPATLPAGGSFYFSPDPQAVRPVLVDDVLAVSLNGESLYAYDFAALGGVPQTAVLELPRAILETAAGETVTFSYLDRYGDKVSASAIWLVWVP